MLMSFAIFVSFSLRAETVQSALIVRPHPDLPNSTRLTLLLQTDMKGWIPTPIVNAFSTKAPKAWHQNLTKYYWEEYSQRKN